MIGTFVFNNIESDSFSLVCKSIKRPLLPAVKVRRIEPVGLSGAYDFDDNVEYELRPLTMRIVYVGTSFEELRSRARNIAAWLSAPTWSKLIIDDEPDKYYLAKVTEEIDLDTLFEAGSADISFDCQPFAYAKNQVSISIGAVGFGAVDRSFENQGTRMINYRAPQGSKFVIDISGSWGSLSLRLNGQTLTYDRPGDGRLIIDNVEMEATMNGENAFSDLEGDIDTFLKIVPGTNTLTIEGENKTLVGTIQFIPLWI